MKTEKAYFAGGCFWCLEAAFELVSGVIEVVNGYAGGTTDKPSYREVCSGTTGHAEPVEIEYDLSKITYEKLLDIFFTVHDPTQVNRQGNDVGTQYRSAIYYVNDEQKTEAEKVIKGLKEVGLNVVTELAPLRKFWRAEEYHQGYYAKHPDEAYCQFVVRPKVELVQKHLEK